MTHDQHVSPNGPPAGSPGGRPAGSPLSRAEAVDLTLLGIDWGLRRIGLAIKPAGQDWALPQATLDVRGGESSALEAVRAAIRRSQAAAVVVGLPVFAGGEQARQIKRFCRKAREGLSGVRWFFVDERLTTQSADALVANVPAGARPTDDLAATLILETFMQSCR